MPIAKNKALKSKQAQEEEFDFSDFTACSDEYDENETNLICCKT